MGRNRFRFCQSKNPQAALVIAVALALQPVAFSQEKEPQKKEPQKKEPQRKEQLIDRIVAIVNSHPILHSDIESKIKTGQMVIVSHYPAKDTASEFEKALQDQINFELILQKADELEITINEADIEPDIKKFLESRNLTLDGLKEALKQQGMTYAEYKEDFADQMIIRKFQGRVINPLIKVTDKDLESYYLKRVGSSSDNVTVNLRQIYIKIPSGSAETVIEGKRKRANEVHAKLKAGTPFAEAAKIYSDMSGATENGGQMPPVQLSDLSEEIKKFIAPLNEGEFTDPIETPAGFYMFYLEKKQFAGSADFVKQKNRLEFELRTEELANQTQKWLAEQRRRSKINLVN